MTAKNKKAVMKECQICNGKGYENIVKPKSEWKNPPKPERTTQICVCMFRTGLSKCEIKQLRMLS